MAGCQAFADVSSADPNYFEAVREKFLVLFRAILHAVFLEWLATTSVSNLLFLRQKLLVAAMISLGQSRKSLFSRPSPKGSPLADGIRRLTIS
jgi:hypothetical protein